MTAVSVHNNLFYKAHFKHKVKRGRDYNNLKLASPNKDCRCLVGFAWIGQAGTDLREYER